LRRIGCERNNSRYEKSNHTWFCVVDHRIGNGFLLQFTRDDDNNDSSNHGVNGSAATGCVAHDDNNDAHGRRLLINVSRSAIAAVAGGPVGRLSTQKKH
jgi:hypothetical protein